MPFVNRRIARRLQSLDAQGAFGDIKSLSEDDIKKYIESEWSRAKELDDKLSKLTAALSVALTVSGVVSKSIVDGLASSPFKWSVLVLLFLSMAFFLYGAIIGFRGLRPKPRFGYGAKFINTVAAGGEEARKTMNEAAAGFEVVNMIRANEASAAIDLIRNGIVLFAIAMALSFVVPAKANDARARLAERCLVAIKECRDEPRHPYISSDRAWPSLAGESSFAKRGFVQGVCRGGDCQLVELRLT
jgi:hypothetical protein